MGTVSSGVSETKIQTLLASSSVTSWSWVHSSINWGLLWWLSVWINEKLLALDVSKYIRVTLWSSVPLLPSKGSPKWWMCLRQLALNLPVNGESVTVYLIISEQLIIFFLLSVGSVCIFPSMYWEYSCSDWWRDSCSNLIFKSLVCVSAGTFSFPGEWAVGYLWILSQDLRPHSHKSYAR